MEGGIDLKCIFCKELCITDFPRLREQGANTINHASQIRQDIIIANPGDYVHKQCRLDYVRRPVFIGDDNSSSESLRSSSDDFNFRTHCFLCGNLVTDREKLTKKRSYISCKNKSVDNSISKVIEERKDDWSIAVKGRLAFVNDLRAEDSLYHIRCNSYFWTGKSNPMSQENSSERKRGRPADGEKEDVFLEITNYLAKYVDHEFTLSEVAEMMKQKLRDRHILFLEMVKKKTSKTFW